jgi:uncharacterized membrane protein
MTSNIGTVDRVLRLVLGVILLVAPFVSNLAIFASTTTVIISVILGIVMIATAAMRFCPLYRLLGIRTCPR